MIYNDSMIIWHIMNSYALNNSIWIATCFSTPIDSVWHKPSEFQANSWPRGWCYLSILYHRQACDQSPFPGDDWKRPMHAACSRQRGRRLQDTRRRQPLLWCAATGMIFPSNGNFWGVYRVHLTWLASKAPFSSEKMLENDRCSQLHNISTVRLPNAP